jgi:3-oxoacyl-[acyl-carrier protein] reductase
VDLGLAGQAFLVTGGSRGLGRAAAQALRGEGADVVLSARTADAVEQAAADLRAVGVAADLADAEAPARLISAATSAFGRVDGALLSVGGPPAGATLELTDDQWRTSFDSVFLGVLRVVRELVPALPRSGGSVVLVLSTSAKSPIAGLAASNGLRPGLGMLVKSLADELGPQGVRVNGLMPGRLATDRVRELDGPDPAVAERIAAGIPLRRYGDPVEFGRVAAFLLSPAASYVTGALVPVDGGAVRAL